MEDVPYERQTVERRNPLARFAHRTRLAKSMGLVRPHLTGSTTLLDYGCGEGRFLHDLAVADDGEHPDLVLLGYDPFMSARFDGYRIVTDHRSIADASVDILTCLEVCEHLSDAETDVFIDFGRRVLTPRGRLLVTVPIEIGPVLPVKELSRAVLHRRRPQLGPVALTKAALLGVPPERAADRLTTHTGYDWRVTRDRLATDFVLEDLSYSPFPYRSWWGQSQVLMTFRTRR